MEKKNVAWLKVCGKWCWSKEEELAWSLAEGNVACCSIRRGVKVALHGESWRWPCMETAGICWLCRVALHWSLLRAWRRSYMCATWSEFHELEKKKKSTSSPCNVEGRERAAWRWGLHVAGVGCIYLFISFYQSCRYLASLLCWRDEGRSMCEGTWALELV